MRKFVRHPSSIPVELSISRAPCGGLPHLRNICNGGFACAVSEPIAVGSAVQLRIPLIWPDYRGCGIVVWCNDAQAMRDAAPLYEVGIEFGAQDVFKTKMVEQLCQIEQYRQQILAEEGRVLDSETAAQEWIERYAKEFSESFGAASNG